MIKPSFEIGCFTRVVFCFSFYLNNKKHGPLNLKFTKYNLVEASFFKKSISTSTRETFFEAGKTTNLGLNLVRIYRVF